MAANFFFMSSSQGHYVARAAFCKPAAAGARLTDSELTNYLPALPNRNHSDDVRGKKGLFGHP